MKTYELIAPCHFGLEAVLKRAREPQTGDFRAGDGAILTITTGGYADKIIVRFPEELIQLNLELNREYIYEFPEAIKTEVYEFNIPLATPGGMYVIEVEAWKNNRKLTVSLPVGLSERVVLSLLWDAEQISQVELASDGPTGV